MKKSDIIKKKNVVLVIRGRKKVNDIDTGRVAMVVYVTKKVPLRELSKADVVPEEIDGLESDVQIAKQIDALSSRHDKWRPMPGGVSVSHPNVSSGTGSPLRIKGRLYIVSNAHVIGDCNDGEIGDQTWQPGSYYGGTSLDTIGHLYIRPLIHFEDEGGMCPWANRFVNFGNFLAKHVFRSRQRIPAPVLDVLNKVDIAVSLPIDEDDLLTEILGIGEPAGFAEAQIGDVVQKSGATSEVNQGAVLDTAGAARVSYGSRGTAAFENQIISTAIASPGDSGSLVFNMQNGLVGVLFAGNDQFTIINKISDVLEALGLN
jgi:S1-C subfamily serine protease